MQGSPCKLTPQQRRARRDRRHANSSMISANEGLRRAASINQSETLSSVS